MGDLQLLDSGARTIYNPTELPSAGSLDLFDRWHSKPPRFAVPQAQICQGLSNLEGHRGGVQHHRSQFSFDVLRTFFTPLAMAQSPLRGVDAGDFSPQ